MDTATRDCELALAAHWSQLGRLPGASLHDDGRILWFQTPVRHLPYNGVVRTRLGDDDAGDVIAAVVETMRARGADLWWAEHPSATPADLGERLAAAGLRPVEPMHYMALDLPAHAAPAAPAGVEVAPVADEAGEAVYTNLTLAYWQVPDDEHAPVQALHAAIRPERLPGQRFLARLDGRPVGKAYLSWPGPPGVASIYGMSVRDDARGRGVAGALTGALIAHAHQIGCHRIVLHATEMATGVYARAGFRRCGTGTAWATAPIWSHDA